QQGQAAGRSGRGPACPRRDSQCPLRGTGQLHPRGDRHPRQRQRCRVPGLQGRRLHRGPGPRGDPRRESGDPVQLRQQLRPYPAQSRTGALSLGSGLSLRSSQMLDSNLRGWLDSQADALDLGRQDGEAVLAHLAASGALRLGVAPEQGGSGGDVVDAVEAIAQVAGHSLTAAFVFWGQRAFIEYLLQSDNTGLRERLLPALLDGTHAGATGLSNAMKYLSGIEQLGVSARACVGGWQLNGQLPWVTNLRKSGFTVAAAIELAGRPPFVAAIPGDLPGLLRSDDLQLLGLQSSNTAAIRLDEVFLAEDWLLASDAPGYLKRVRPSFLGLQCGMALG